MSLMLANRYFLEGRDESAVPQFLRHLEQHPEDRQASLRLAASLLRAGLVQEADLRLDAMEPLKPEGLILRCLCRLRLNGEEDACRFLQERSGGMDWLFWWNSESAWVKPFVQELWAQWREALLDPFKSPQDFPQWLAHSLGRRKGEPS